MTKTSNQLRNENVFVKSEIKSLSEISGFPSRKGLENVVLSEGQIVNVVSDSYGHLPNEKFFYDVERRLIDAGINYETQSINRENRSFAVDYILQDESFTINVAEGITKFPDKLRPMLRFVNSYDGSCKTSGHIAIYRQVCSNGLHALRNTDIGFSVKHRSEIIDIVFPEINSLVTKFMDNEFYTLRRKFEVLAESPIKDLTAFVKYVCGKTGLFQYEASEKNPDPSLNSRLVMETINSESILLNSTPNLWLGYNAFNELLHGKLKKSFEQQKQIDAKLFDAVYEMASN